jgi:4-amino-4-deoxy-L-arabinose transferase-like glycosyltransferase
VNHRLASAAPVALSLALAAALLLPGLGAAPFDDPGEGQHAEIAREMAASGQWLSLTLNGVRYLDKPPLLYWLAAAAFSLGGLHEWAARLAPLLGAGLAAAATALLGARLLGTAGGLLAAGALLSSALFLAFGRYLRPETLFVAGIQWGFAGLLLAVSDGEPDRRRRWSLIGCAALGAASLAKDPLGLVGPLLAIGLALALGGRLRPLSRWLPSAGVALLLVIGAGWYLLELRQPGFAWYTVVDNHLLNAARLRHFPDEDVPLSGVEFLAVSLLGIVPWIIPAALAITSILRRREWRDPGQVAWTALALWAVGVLALFTLLPFRLPHYALPAYPAIALLAARGWREGSARALSAAHLLLFALIATICLLAARGDGRAFVETVFSATDVYTRKEAALGQGGSLPAWSALAPLVARTGLVCAVGCAGLAALSIRRAHGSAGWLVLATMLAAMPAVPAAVSIVAAGRAVAGLSAEVRRQLGPDDLLVHEGPIENSGALELYSGRRPILVEARRSVLGFGATFADAAETFWDAARFRREWCSGRPVLLVTPRDREQSLVSRLPAASARLLFEGNGRWLYRAASPAPC